MLTSVLLLITNQLVEVPLHRFREFAEPHVIAAVALSPDAHTVSVWTRWSPQTPCLRWTVDVQSGRTEGFGEDACPEPALPPEIRCNDKGCHLGRATPLGEVELQGVPTRSQLTVHLVDPVIAINFERALSFVSLTDGRLISSFSHAGFAIRGVAASNGEWLLWAQNQEGVDRLYLADGAELIAPRVDSRGPFVRPVARVRLPASFGWTKDTTGTSDSPCDFFERGLMIEDDLLMLDWKAGARPLDLRVRGQGGQLQKWRIDISSPTPVPGLTVERMQLTRQERWRLKIRLPFPIDALAISEGGARVARLSPIAWPMSIV